MLASKPSVREKGTMKHSSTAALLAKAIPKAPAVANTTHHRAMRRSFLRGGTLARTRAWLASGRMIKTSASLLKALTDRAKLASAHEYESRLERNCMSSGLTQLPSLVKSVEHSRTATVLLLRRAGRIEAAIPRRVEEEEEEEEAAIGALGSRLPAASSLPGKPREWPVSGTANESKNMTTRQPLERQPVSHGPPLLMAR